MEINRQIEGEKEREIENAERERYKQKERDRPPFAREIITVSSNLEMSPLPGRERQADRQTASDVLLWSITIGQI